MNELPWIALKGSNWQKSDEPQELSYTNEVNFLISKKNMTLLHVILA